MVMRVFIVIVMVVMLLVVVMVMIVMVFVLLMRMLVVMVVMRMLVLRLIGGVLGAHLLQQARPPGTPFQWPPGWSCRPAGPRGW